jgi:hypothetical protein
MEILTVFLYLVLILNPVLYSCFIGKVTKNWRQAGIGLRMCHFSRCPGGT